MVLETPVQANPSMRQQWVLVAETPHKPPEFTAPLCAGWANPWGGTRSLQVQHSFAIVHLEVVVKCSGYREVYSDSRQRMLRVCTVE